MLLAVEGGGFFSSSASGYSKGLTLLFLGQKNEDKLMRVSPWNHYQLVDEAPDPDQLASAKTRRLSRACACFRRASTGLDTLKGCPTQQKDVLPGSLISDSIDTGDDENCVTKVSLKSNLKKPSNNGGRVSTESINEHESLVERSNAISGYTEKRKVQWTDACGSDLVEIREFEPSEVDGSDDELDNGNEKSCLCTIM